ncbi:helix-turn-helix domain-containing protein [Chryseobacterium soli]|nr:helix-turn-helix domain-containing protein [Chryseobacterium soli]
MNSHFKNIHLGSLIKKRSEELKIEVSRICNFLHCTEKDIEEMFLCKSLDSEILLRWSKLLGYDFFRLYSQHLILYAPPAAVSKINLPVQTTNLPQFRKNIYSKEIIDHILEIITNGEKTKNQVIKEYNIPKTTLYKWFNKYSKIEV